MGPVLVTWTEKVGVPVASPVMKPEKEVWGLEAGRGAQGDEKAEVTTLCLPLPA